MGFIGQFLYDLITGFKERNEAVGSSWNERAENESLGKVSVKIPYEHICDDLNLVDTGSRYAAYCSVCGMFQWSEDKR